MKRLLFLPLIVLLLAACSQRHDNFVLEGSFKGFSQGELYIYGVNGAWPLDTIGVAKGKFRYAVPITEPTAFVIVFPNFAELLVMGEPGADVEIEGDASHLLQTKITGTKENEALTTFRRQAAEMTPQQAADAVFNLLKEYPQAPFAAYLIQRYYIQSPTPDYKRAAEIAKLISLTPPQLPNNGDLIRWLKGIDALRDGNKLPQFTATDLNGRSVSNIDLKAPVNVITTWSSWNYESINLQRQLQNRFRQAGSDMKILSICLDADINDCRRRVTRDSVKWSTVCDGRMWESPVLNALGLAFVPDNIVTDASGKIVAHGLQNRDLLTKIDNLLPKKPKD